MSLLEIGLPGIDDDEKDLSVAYHNHFANPIIQVCESKFYFIWIWIC